MVGADPSGALRALLVAIEVPAEAVEIPARETPRGTEPAAPELPEAPDRVSGSSRTATVLAVLALLVSGVAGVAVLGARRRAVRAGQDATVEA